MYWCYIWINETNYVNMTIWDFIDLYLYIYTYTYIYTYIYIYM